MVGRDTSEPNARGDRVRLACKRWSANRESPGFIRGECQVCLANQVAYGGVEGFGYGSGSGNRQRIFVPFVYGSVSKSTFFSRKNSVFPCPSHSSRILSTKNRPLKKLGIFPKNFLTIRKFTDIIRSMRATKNPGPSRCSSRKYDDDRRCFFDSG